MSPWATAGSSELGWTLVFIAAVIARRRCYVPPRGADLLFGSFFAVRGELDIGPIADPRTRPLARIAAGTAGRLFVRPVPRRPSVPEAFVFYMLAWIVGHGVDCSLTQAARPAPRPPAEPA